MKDAGRWTNKTKTATVWQSPTPPSWFRLWWKSGVGGRWPCPTYEWQSLRKRKIRTISPKTRDLLVPGDWMPRQKWEWPRQELPPVRKWWQAKHCPFFAKGQLRRPRRWYSPTQHSPLTAPTIWPLSDFSFLMARRVSVSTLAQIPHETGEGIVSPFIIAQA